jgi:citrate lyase subunit beta/citryl-CoA lyase
VDPVSARGRSWLFVPATRPERFGKAAESGADRIIIDLEDAVAAEAKRAARAQLARAAIPYEVPFYVRVNACGTSWFQEDVEAVRRLPIAGIVLPKTETAESVARLASSLDPEQRVVPIVESATGIWNVLEIARAPRVERLAFGAIDFQLDTGIRGEDLELAYARSRVVVASRVAGLEPPIDSITESIHDEERLARDAQRARSFGFGGKLCIHPRQIAGTHRAFTPTEQEVEWARGLLEALDGQPAGERGAFTYRGAMVDRPVIDRARQIVAAAAEAAQAGPA